MRASQKTYDVKIDYDENLGSNHYPIIFSYSLLMEGWNGQKKKALVRDFKKMDITKFKEDLSKSVIADNDTGRYGNLENGVSLYNETMTTLLDKQVALMLKRYSNLDQMHPGMTWI